MALKRRPRQMTFRGLKRRIERDEKKELQRTLGRWNNFQTVGIETIGSSSLGTNLDLPLPPNSATKKTEIYAMDSQICIHYSQSSSAGVPIMGALGVCHVRPGQRFQDFAGVNLALPQGTDENQIARFRAFIPFTLVPPLNTSAGQPWAVTIIPYRFFRGRRITLNVSEKLTMLMMFGRSTTSGARINITWHGRYRYIAPSI